MIGSVRSMQGLAKLSANSQRQLLGQTSKSRNVHSKAGEVCIVTGASRGIGKEIALALGNDKSKVVVNYTSSEGPANEVVELIKSAGGEAIAVKANVSMPEEASALVKAAVDEWGTVDVLINNAGITRDNLMMRMKPEQWQEVIDVNLSGPFYCAQVTAEIPLSRFGQPAEVAGLIRYLALDPSAAYITGQVLTIDGGISI